MPAQTPPLERRSLRGDGTVRRTGTEFAAAGCMLICRFSGPSGPDQLMAPVARVRIVQGALYADGEQKPAASYQGDRWRFRGRDHTAVTIEGPLCVSLHDTERGTPLHTAAYRKVWFADGALHAPSGILATLDAGTQLWQDAATGRYAHELRVELRTHRMPLGTVQMESSIRR